LFWTPIASSAQAGSDDAFIGEPSICYLRLRRAVAED
jgi:hypothetical protein